MNDDFIICIARSLDILLFPLQTAIDPSASLFLMNSIATLSAFGVAIRPNRTFHRRELV